mmetsp:Transcript_28925/g.41244  ORF Transcript_28925/g.41244 Transcript_28925/m.41244 type:complete len:581 (+) Transcript_28925:57-1799(+)
MSISSLLSLFSMCAFCTYRAFSFMVIKRFIFNGKSRILRYCNALPEGFTRREDVLKKSPSPPKQPIPVTDVSHLKELIHEGYRVRDLDVRGDTTFDSDQLHPVVKALHNRIRDGSIPGNRTDGHRIAISIEGGGMRGCVGAGMISAVKYLGLEDAVDVVYGSSAGSLVGAYFVTGQLPYVGPEVYYDVLTTAGKEFIDVQALLRSCGLGIFDLRLKSLVDLFQDRLGKPVLNLNYLFDTIVQRIKPLDFPILWEKHMTSKLELKVVASGLLSRKAVVLSAKNGNFQDLQELAECMKASMLLPGLTGDVIRLKGRQAAGDNIERTWWREYNGRSNSSMLPGSEPLSDALLFEPIPYRCAIANNSEGRCTHVLALRTRPDNCSVTLKMGIMEKLILYRFFGRKQGLPELVHWMHNQYHKLVYAEDILRLNAANRDFTDSPIIHSEDGNVLNPKLFCVALPYGTPEVSRLETSRANIFQAVRSGFAAAYDSLTQDPKMKGQGMRIAMEVWPESILSQPPVHLKKVVDEQVVALPPADKIEKALQEAEAVRLMPMSKRQELLASLQRLQTIIIEFVETKRPFKQ